MDYYFVAKTKETGFIGQLRVEEIARRLHDGQILGDYVATKSVGPSYSQLMKSGTAVWITVAELIANPLPQNHDIPAYSPNEQREKFTSPHAAEARNIMNEPRRPELSASGVPDTAPLPSITSGFIHSVFPDRGVVGDSTYR